MTPREIHSLLEPGIISLRMGIRKIIHVDMDAFYASVEQRDDPQLRGKPVIVAWKGNRSVVCAASYEARDFGVRSAMPAARAERLCPSAVFIAPDFTRYRAVKAGIRSDSLCGSSTQQVPAKLASGWRKPDGLFVIQPEDVDAFLLPISVGPLPGVGKVTQEKLAKLAIRTVSELRGQELAKLEKEFGRYGVRLYELARGIDENQVVPDRPTKSISVEDTFQEDVLLAETEPMIRRLVEKLWSASRNETRVAHTVVLKLKTREFNILTRSHTPNIAPSSYEEVMAIALQQLERVDLGPQQRYRLVGIGLSNFREPEVPSAQPVLFE
jgi:DNA polymerase IV